MPPIEQKRMVAFINHFIVNTVSFLNEFLANVESKFVEFESKLQNIEASLQIVEAKVFDVKMPSICVQYLRNVQLFSDGINTGC